jgi:hypothetical protein
MRGALVVIAVLLGVSVVGLLVSRVHPVAKIVVAVLAGVGVLALLWLAFLFQLKGMGGD